MKLRALFFALVIGVTSLQASLFSPPPNVQGASVIVIDANTGAVLYARNPNEPRPVGSTQKILTALIVAEHGNLGRTITIQPIDEKTEPTMLNLRPGDQYTRQELLTALLVKSPNDVARALARDQAGSLESFAEMMNQRAAELGAHSSHFINPNGLPAPGQYSTAADMAKIAIAVYHNSTLRNIISMKSYPFRYANGAIHLLKNTNHTMQNTSFCNGMKTGYTDKSKHCLITSGCYQGHDAITVILGSPDRNQLFYDSALLLGWALGAPPPIQTLSHAVRHTSRKKPPSHKTLHNNTPKKYYHKKRKKNSDS